MRDQALTCNILIFSTVLPLLTVAALAVIITLLLCTQKCACRFPKIGNDSHESIFLAR